MRQRLPHLLDYLKEVAPDAICLQEIKCQDDAFPREEVEALGYNIATHGQKGFNGVAILCKHPMEVERGLPGDESDVQSRYLEAVIPWGRRVLRLASLYLPNGNPVATEKYGYKLGFMDRLIRHARKQLALEEPFVIAGDYNVIPEARDAAHPEQWTGDALFLPQTRAKYQELTALGLTDALRATTDAGGVYTSGTIRPAPGSAITASGSTISCCRRRRLTGSSARPWTRRCGRGRRRPTMCR